MLKLASVTYSYDNIPALDDISFSIENGKCAAIIGESGCGKSTLLKLIYGIYDADSGSISYNGKNISGPKYNLLPGAGNIKYVAQDFDLMPFITVSENVGRFLSNQDKNAKQARISELLALVGLESHAGAKAKDLSGGQQQRVALARALAMQPRLLLLDEPFNQVDAFRRNGLRRDLFRYLQKNDITCLIATHDSADILSYADQVIVLRQGKMVRDDTPVSVYGNPGSGYIASLFDDVMEWPEGSGNLLYPHQLEITSRNGIGAQVIRSYFRGGHFIIEATSEGRAILVQHGLSLLPGTKIQVRIRTSENSDLP